MTRIQRTTKTYPPSKLVQYLVLYVWMQAREREISNAEIQRALGTAKGTITKHFKFENQPGREEGLDAYVTTVAQVLDMSPRDLWQQAFKLWDSDPNGRLLKQRLAQIAASDGHGH